MQNLTGSLLMPNYHRYILQKSLFFFFFLKSIGRVVFSFLIEPSFSLYLFIYLLFMAVLGLCFCARAFSSCGKRRPLFIAVRGPLTVVASLVAEHRLQKRRLSSCGSRAQSLHGMWDLPRPRLEPVTPALAGRFSTTAPPGKPSSSFFNESNVTAICDQVKTLQMKYSGHFCVQTYF